MTMNMETDLLPVPEQDYERFMADTAVPYIQLRCTETYMEREPGKKIHCMYFQADMPEGVVVISHGYTETIEKYTEVIYYFLKKQYSVWMHEHCGHGFSYRLTDDFSLVHVDYFSRYIRDLVFVAREARQKAAGLPVYLYAHSMGGGIGAAAAAKAPELFDKIVLSSPMIRPLTGGVPWRISRDIAAIKCFVGKNGSYVAGQHPYTGKDTFEESCATSEARFNYYNRKRTKEVHFQTCAASYGWLHGADTLNRYLQQEAWKHICVPVLLFQAAHETVVSVTEQKIFVEKINRNGRVKAALVVIPGAKHEIFNSQNDVLAGYWEKVFDFISR